MSDFLMGHLLGGMAERHRQGMQRAARTASGIVSDQGLIAEIHRLRALVTQEQQNAERWRVYAAGLEERIEGMMRAQGLIA